MHTKFKVIAYALEEKYTPSDNCHISGSDIALALVEADQDVDLGYSLEAPNLIDMKSLNETEIVLAGYPLEVLSG